MPAAEHLRRVPASGGHACRLLALAPGLMACLLAVSSCEEPSPQQRIENAQAFLQRGNAQLAIAELKRVITSHPDNEYAFHFLGAAH